MCLFNDFYDSVNHFPAPKCQNHYNYASKFASRNSHNYPGYPGYPCYPPETVGELQFEPTLPHAPGVRITVVFANLLKLTGFDDY